MNKEDFPAFFLDSVGRALQQDVPLRDYSRFRIGGTADFFFDAFSSVELLASVRTAREFTLPYYVIGAGCNLLFDDQGFRGLIIRNRTKGLTVDKEKGEIEALSGTPLEDMIHLCLEEGLSGLEALAGIPGTIGGAVSSNAGAFGGCIGDCLKEAFLLDEKGEEIGVEKKYFAFGYRYSSLKIKHDLLLKAVFALRMGEMRKIKERIDEILEKRNKRHPSEDTAYAGSYFKNPVLPDGEKVVAAFLLDDVGAKDIKVGGAAVYEGHANFILNQGEATAKNILSLAQELKRRVKEKHNIELEEEVIFLPADFSMP